MCPVSVDTAIWSSHFPTYSRFNILNTYHHPVAPAMSSSSPFPPSFFCHLVSGYTVLLCEWLSHFDDEVRLVWSLPGRSWTKWNFLFLQYGGLFLQGALLYQNLDLQYHDYPPFQCRSWFIMGLMVPTIIGTLVQGTLVGRVCALYHQERFIKQCVIFLFFMQTATVFAMWAVVIRVPVTYSPRCQPGVPLKIWPFLVAGFLPLALECLLIFLTIFKVIPLFHIPNAPSVLHIITRDGIWAFVLVTVATAIPQIFLISGNLFWQSAFVNWMSIVVVFVGTRIILNMLQLKNDAQPKRQGSTEQYMMGETHISLTNVIPLGLDISVQYFGGKSTYP